MSRRVRLTVAYDGTRYAGWQRQKNGMAVQECLEEAIWSLFHERVSVDASGRTDAGVHAWGQVAAFTLEHSIPIERLALALNSKLPQDIRVMEAAEAAWDFHPQFQAKRKTYRYTYFNGPFLPPQYRLYMAHIHEPMDMERMNEAAKSLVGEHDFTALSSAQRTSKTTVRRIYEARVYRDVADARVIHIEVTGNGFLYNMVRIIAGTLVKIGMGVYPPEKMEEILEEKNRAAAGPTIPARGLTLVSLEYEKELAPYLEGENKHWHYVLDQRNVPEKGLAYLTIERCEPEELDGVLRRVIHQAYRNGAKQVFVRDTFGEEGSIYGYYRLRRQPEVEEGWLEAIYEGEHQ